MQNEVEGPTGKKRYVMFFVSIFLNQLQLCIWKGAVNEESVSRTAISNTAAGFS